MDQPMADFSPAAALLQQARRVVIGGHPQMDGDALGSLLALRSALMAAGRQCVAVTQDHNAGKYGFLAGAHDIKPLDQAGDLSGYDTCIMVDCGAESRARAVLQRLAPGTRVLNVDHHIDNPGFGDVALVFPHASSTGEVVFHVLEAAGIALNKAAAEALFVAIVTDTGRFMFSNSTPESYRIVAQLVEDFSLDVADLTGRIYRSKTMQRMRLEGMVTQTLQTRLDGRIAIATVTREMLRDTGCSEADAAEMVTIPKSLAGSMVCILLREVGDSELKVSWRSEGQIAVNEIAAQFNGGGHLRASGANPRGKPIAQLKDEVVEATVRALEETLRRTGGAIIV
ncbi:MAG: bifunctional oligoribonuclease/PAP phosphatase NrnA [Planctomycetes bacterium]|nr:bifunctional oligoribonuclease/PAP phosphatase NrnA [Planctomycetota bacterium]MCW8136824.1 bifunctional oligoribonuclease/PAP phosphatase NrnA [Planctomycetota bacterium]